MNNEHHKSFLFSNFANGLYYVSILCNKNNNFEKLIIQK